MIEKLSSRDSSKKHLKKENQVGMFFFLSLCPSLNGVEYITFVNPEEVYLSRSGFRRSLELELTGAVLHMTNYLVSRMFIEPFKNIVILTLVIIIRRLIHVSLKLLYVTTQNIIQNVKNFTNFKILYLKTFERSLLS